jgi:hypothetical protein
MKRVKTRILANRRKAKLKAKRRRQRARATGLAILAFVGMGMTMTGCAQAATTTNSSIGNPSPTDCLRVYDPRCGAIPRWDPIRDGHGG